MARIYLPYLLSGFVSLIYQVCWYRYFVDKLGANNITFVLVLCGFVGGIGLGLFLFSGLPNYIVGAFPYTLRDNVYQPIPTYQALKAVSVGLCVLTPCFFMGITFPLLCATFKRREKFPARLYAFNTLGACGGVLVAEFILIRYVRTTVAFCTALLINALIGAKSVRSDGAHMIYVVDYPDNHRELYFDAHAMSGNNRRFLQRKAGLDYNPLALLKDFQQFSLQSYARIYETLESLEAIHQVVPDFPIPLPRKRIPPKAKSPQPAPTP